jgi:N4-(beta-N-acetylglucosaminyl)-L-asparaginase
MEHTDHIFLVGQGATRFAKDMGFEQVNLLTDRARKTWLLWRETRSLVDAWGPGLDAPEFRQAMQEKATELGLAENERDHAIERVLHRPTGTINCLGVNGRGEISGVTTTSGLAWKIPGRVGDSPIIGAGCFVDGEVGGGGSTGRGEENIRIAGGHTVVEAMRQGKNPTEACLEALRRVQHNFRNFPARLKLFDLAFYALRVDGAYGCATLWDTDEHGRRRQFAVNDGTTRLEDAAYLLHR